MEWGIWRQDAHGNGEWCASNDPDELFMVFNSYAEAQKVAGVWNATSHYWRYTARRFC